MIGAPVGQNRKLRTRQTVTMGRPQPGRFRRSQSIESR
jgi:hypothetical protein